MDSERTFVRRSATGALRRSGWTLTAALLAALLLVLAPAVADADGGPEPGQDTGSDSRSCPTEEAAVVVPGAEFQDADCLRDLTTAGTTQTGHTNRADWNGLNASGTENPRGVPGLQIDGYFPDDSYTNTNNGFNHDAQFVIRFPNDWNGKLVVTGSPGNRGQYANDFIISDFVLAEGYAFAATDKGNTGIAFYEDGEEPGDAVAEWHYRVEQLTRAAKAAAESNYGRAPGRTYVTGISNGGYLTRYALENTPELYDGGVDWEGTLFRSEGPNLLTYLPVALRNYPKYAATGDRRAYRLMIRAGFERGSEFLWGFHYAYYWDLTQRIYREEFDPGYDGDLKAGIPFCQPGTPNCDADYDYRSRPQEVKEAVAKVENTGDIGKPMITLHGTLDTLLPRRADSDVYANLVRKSGNGGTYRYLVVEDGNHVDGLYDLYPDKLRPILPCYREAFLALDEAVDGGEPLPGNRYIPKPKRGDPVNECDLKGGRR